MNIETVKSWRPCSDGLVWLNSQPDLDTAWRTCQRGDWLLWGLRQGDILDKTTAVRIAVAFADHVLPVFDRKYPEDTRPRVAIEAVKAWLKKPTKANRRAAAAAAYAAAAAADAAADAADAAAAADTAYAVYHAYAAAIGAAEVAADAYDDARAKERKWQADKLRELCANPFLDQTHAE